MEKTAIPVALLAMSLFACAGQQQTTGPEAARATEVAAEIDALKRAIEASYDRERAMAERLRAAEEVNTELRREVNAQQDRLGALASRLDTFNTTTAFVASKPPVFSTGRFDAPSKYRIARENYNNRQYERALGQFAEVVMMAPRSSLADNGQYWIGECYYGLGKFRQALTEFTKVFAYPKTEKSDDAQLKIGRCYLALGEKESALLAFQKLLDEYAESEYVDMARKEMSYLQPRSR